MSNVRPVTALIYPRGTCKAQTFYFRGDDIHREPEFLDNELRSAKIEYEQLKRELEEEKKEYEKVQSELAKREGYTVTLASALGDECHQTEENAKLRQQIADLTQQIDDVDTAISEAREQQHPGLIAQLQKERAFYNAEIEDLRIGIFTGIDNIRNEKEEIANVVTSDAYTQANLVKSDRVSFQKFYQMMRCEMDKLFADFSGKQADAARAHQPVAKLPPEFQGICQTRLNAILEKEEATRQKTFIELRAKLTAEILIDQIETMNQTLIALGGEPIDTDKIREEYIPQPPPPPEEEEDQASTRDLSKTKKQDLSKTKKRELSKTKKQLEPKPAAKTWKSIPKPRSRM